MCNMRAGKFSLGLVTNQSSREGSGWSIWKVDTASVDCFLRTIKRVEKERGRVAVKGICRTMKKWFVFVWFWFSLVFFLRWKRLGVFI